MTAMTGPPESPLDTLITVCVEMGLSEARCDRSNWAILRRKRDELRRKVQAALTAARQDTLIENLKAARDWWRDECKGLRDFDAGNTWMWAGDAEDHPESLTCPVVMSADQLRELLTARDTEDIDIVFDGPPGPESGRFVETENGKGQGISAGEWIDRGDGYWVLRIPRAQDGALLEWAEEHGLVLEYIERDHPSGWHVRDKEDRDFRGLTLRAALEAAQEGSDAEA